MRFKKRLQVATERARCSARFVVCLSVAALFLASCDTQEESDSEPDPARPGKPTALSCVGTTENLQIKPNGEFYTTKMDESRTFIFDEVRKTIFTLSSGEDPTAGANYSSFCDLQDNCAVTASGQAVMGIMIDDEAPMIRRREIKIDRVNGTLRDTFRYKDSSGSESAYNSVYRCSRVETPEAYQERFGPRKF